MLKLIVFTTTQTNKLYEIIDKWDNLGCKWVTILDAHELRNVGATKKKVEIPLVNFSMNNIFRKLRIDSHLAFTIVSDELAIKSTDIVVETLQPSNHDDGVLFVIDIEHAIGIRKSF